MVMNLSRQPLLVETVCDSRKKNDPWRTPSGPKKFAVCVSDNGKTKLVRFGDPGLEIKRDSEKRRKNFRARHNCQDPGPKTKAKYWACKTWERKKTVKDVVGECRTLQAVRVVLEQQPVPADWPKKVGYPPPGMIRMSAYPAGQGKGPKGKGTDAQYPDTEEGRKIAKAQAWLFPSKITRAGKKTYQV